MTQEAEIDFKSRGYEIEVRNLSNGRTAEIILEFRRERWVVKTDRFYGSYSGFDSAMNQALKLVKKKLLS